MRDPHTGASQGNFGQSQSLNLPALDHPKIQRSQFCHIGEKGRIKKGLEAF